MEQINCNPFFFFVLDRESRWVDAIEASSRRARNAYGPTMGYLHELGHVEGCMFPSMIEGCNMADEQHITDDVDNAVRYHPGIGLRDEYLLGDGGRRWYLDRFVEAVPHWNEPRRGSQWIIIPERDEVISGRRQ
jgi:hypothetical protein